MPRSPSKRRGPEVSSRAMRTPNLRSTRPLVAATILLGALPAFGQSSSADWAARVANNYQISANVTYLTANNYESKLDVYSRRGATTPQPTVVYFHGGFWAAGSKEGALLSLIPWLEMG